MSSWHRFMLNLKSSILQTCPMWKIWIGMHAFVWEVCPCWFSSFLVLRNKIVLMCDLLSSLHAVLGLLALQHRNSNVDWGMKTQIIKALSLNTFQSGGHPCYPSLKRLTKIWLIYSSWRFGWLGRNLLLRFWRNDFGDSNNRFMIIRNFILSCINRKSKKCG